MPASLPPPSRPGDAPPLCERAGEAAPAGAVDAAATAALLPWVALADEIEALLRDPGVHTPPRLVMPTAGGASLFVMPAHDGRTAISKLITYTPLNAGTPRPVIQGEVLVFDIATGTRLQSLDGPVVTARRTAAVTLVAARCLARTPAGPLLIVGAGVQGQAHLEALAAGLPGLAEVRIVSRRRSSAEALATVARGLGLTASVVADADAALPACPLVVTCTPADAVVLRGPVREDAFVAAVGAFTPAMAELDPALCHDVTRRGRIVVDSGDAAHEAGDLLQAGLDVGRFPTLGAVLQGEGRGHAGPVLFKSCGWAGWDLAAARLARHSGDREPARVPA